MDDLRWYLIAEELTSVFESPERMRAAGYRTVSEFFVRHGWHLTVREIHEILDREAEIQK
jgi:hypothetical protein